MQLRLLGGLGLTVDGRALPVAGRKERLLLTLLALEAGRDVDQDRMIDALWGDSPPRTAVKSLHSHVWRLRTELEASATGAEILRAPHGYRLAVPADAVDVNIVESLLAAGRTDAQVGRHAEAVDAFERALAYWQGRSLGEFADEPSLAGDAARFDELRVAISEARVEALLALGQHGAAIGALEPLCADNPYREPLVALRMLALYRAGRQADALTVLQDLRARLRDELGLEPSAPLNELEHAILTQSPGLDWRNDAVAPAPRAATGTLRVMLVDDHPMWRQAVRGVLECDTDVTVVAEADDGDAALALIEECAPDLVLMDLHLPGIGGIEATRQIVGVAPATRVLVLSASEDEDDVRAALRAGAYGYVLKTGSGHEVVEAVRRVLAGEAVFSPALSSVVLAELRRPAIG